MTTKDCEYRDIEFIRNIMRREGLKITEQRAYFQGYADAEQPGRTKEVLEAVGIHLLRAERLLSEEERQLRKYQEGIYA